MGSVVWSSRANDDLVAIHAYISGSSEPVARRLVDRLTRRANQLAEFPLLGNVVPEYGVDLVRELKEHPYRIIYEVFPDRVHILTIVHSARQLDQE